jgi:hypothetical protein
MVLYLTQALSMYKLWNFDHASLKNIRQGKTYFFLVEHASLLHKRTKKF